MNLAQLPYIMTIAKTGNLSAAARELGLSPSALSRYLSRLETKVGGALFFHVKKRMHPTPVGRRYLQTAQQILDILDSTRRSIAMLDTPAVQELRIGISPHSGARILAEACVPFSHHFPAVRLVPREGYANDLKELLREDAIDLCVTSGEDVKGLERFPVSREEIVLAVPAAQAAAFRQGADGPGPWYAGPEDFRSAVFVLPDNHSALYDYVAPLLTKAGFQPQIAFTTPNVIMLRKMISSGAGVGFLPLRHALADPQLHIFHLRPLCYITYAIFIREGHNLDEIERYLLFLWLNNSISKGSDMVWNDFNRKLIWQYAPGEAASLQMERPQ